MSGFCEHGDEHPGDLNLGKLHWLNSSLLLWENFACGFSYLQVSLLVG